MQEVVEASEKAVVVPVQGSTEVVAVTVAASGENYKQEATEKLRQDFRAVAERAASSNPPAASSSQRSARSSSKKRVTIFSEERPENLQLRTLLRNWLVSVEVWCRDRKVHPGRGLQALTAKDRSILQLEADAAWEPDPHEVAVRGVTYMSTLGARGTQDLAMQLLAGREGRILLVILLAFTFDRPDVTDRLVELVEGGAAVILVADKKSSLSGWTKEMLGCLRRLAAAGVVVRVGDGDDSRSEYEAVGRAAMGARGIHHCKGLLVHLGTESRALIGSCNWTTSSRTNRELGSYITCKSDAVPYHLERFGLPVLLSEDFNEAARAAHLRKEGATMRSSSATR